MNINPVTALSFAAPALQVLPAVRGAGRSAPVAARGEDGPPAPTPVSAAPSRVQVARNAFEVEQTAEAVAAANRRLAEKGSELTIEFEDSVNRMVFRLVDRETREVLRQIPSEQALALARALADDGAAGVLVRADA